MILELVSILKEQLVAERERGNRLELLLSRKPEEITTQTLAPIIPGRKLWSERAKELSKIDRDKARVLLEEVESEINDAS